MGHRLSSMDIIPQKVLKAQYFQGVWRFFTPSFFDVEGSSNRKSPTH
jgi:hypothetical protein